MVYLSPYLFLKLLTMAEKEYLWLQNYLHARNNKNHEVIRRDMSDAYSRSKKSKENSEIALYAFFSSFQ